MKSFKFFLGIDISKLTLDLALITADNELIELKFNNEDRSISKSLKQLYSDYEL